MSFLTRYEDDQSRPEVRSALRDLGMRVLLPGIVVFGIMLASLSRTVRSYFWEKTPCTIVESRHLEPGPETAA